MKELYRERRNKEEMTCFTADRGIVQPGNSGNPQAKITAADRSNQL